MNAKQREAYREGSIKFLKSLAGKPVYVSGTWTGDFVGRVFAVGESEASFRVEKPLSDAVKAGDVFAFPYGVYLKVREATDVERQITISEAEGDIVIT